MGTRNLVGVVQDGQWKVAQYGQWDGYPSGQGKTVVEFLRKASLSKFKNKLQLCRFGTTEELEAIYNQFESKPGWLTLDEADKFSRSQWNYLSRDTGAEILKFIYNREAKNPIVLQDSHDFLNDGLFCEWAYIVDLDKNKLVVLKGFGKEPPSSDVDSLYVSTGYELTASEDKGKKYVVPIKKYPLDKVPTVKDFLAEMDTLLKKLYPDEYDEEEEPVLA